MDLKSNYRIPMKLLIKYILDSGLSLMLIENLDSNHMLSRRFVPRVIKRNA